MKAFYTLDGPLPPACSDAAGQAPRILEVAIFEGMKPGYQISHLPRIKAPMPARTINDAFYIFHRRLTPTNFESGKASSHKSSITRRLEEHFNLRQLFYSGSARNGTSISRRSDADFFASIPTRNLKQDSAKTLRQVKECLRGRFPNTPIYVDSPSVVLEFGAGEWDKAEIIPADYLERTNNQNVYDIPDGKGSWMRSSPSTHNTYVREHNDRLSKKLKPLIRFLKAWKYYRDVPISSFYLELRITKLMEQEKTILYEIDTNNILQKLLDSNLSSIRDPRGVSGLVSACSSASKNAEAISKLDRAAGRAQKARDAEHAGRVSDAFDWWNLVFAEKFPARYY